MQVFNSIIFMRNDSCIGKVEILKRLLDEGITILSGLQQPAPFSSDEEFKMNKKLYLINQNEIEDIVRDIAMALLGKRIIIQEV